jgi:hypothetical protein
MKNWKDCNWIRVLFIFAIVLTYFACKEDDPDYSCKCEWGNNYFIVLDTDTLCGNRDCINKNKEKVAGKRLDNGIPVTNREGIDDFGEMLDRVKTALAHEQLSSEARQKFIKDNIKEIEIVLNDGHDLLPPSSGVLIISNIYTAFSIRTALRLWCEANDISALFKQLDSSKDTVHFVFASTKGGRTI